VEKEKNVKKPGEELVDKKKQEEMERDLRFMRGKYEMATHIYPPFLKLSEQLSGKVKGEHELREATSVIVSAMMAPLKSGETRNSKLSKVLETYNIGIEEISSINKLINNPNVDMATGLSNLIGFFGHKYANKQPSPNEQAFIEGLRAAQAGAGKTADAESKKPGDVAKKGEENQQIQDDKSIDPKFIEKRDKEKQPTKELRTGKSLSGLSKEMADAQEKDFTKRNMAERKDNRLQ